MLSRPPTALVLAGGGARGAYEAGVLLFALDALPRRTGIRAAFDTFAGTSVGALNACFMAATCHSPARSAQELAGYWRNIHMGGVFRFGSRELFKLQELLLGRRWGGSLLAGKRPPPNGHIPVAGVLDTTPLSKEMETVIPWEHLRRNMATGPLRGLALCATEVCTGKAVIFYETTDGVSFLPARDPAKSARPVRLCHCHAMASSAIPFLFPSVQVDGVCYVDGALHLNTPLYPALRMGAERLLVISLGQESRVRYSTARLGCRQNPYPGAVFLLGRVVGALMDQALDYELSRLEMFNQLLDTGDQLLGPAFRQNLDQVTDVFRNTRYRAVRSLHIQPSRDLNEVALEVLREAPHELALPGPVGRALHKVLLSRPFVESELTSFLMFTPSYARKLVQLGYEDGLRHEEALVAFFKD